VNNRKKPIIIGIVICFVLAASITYWTRRGESGGSVGREHVVYMLCTNPDCGKTFEMSVEQYREKVATGRLEKVVTPNGSIVFRCESCGQETLHIAEKCPKCGTIFIPNYSKTDDWPDRCPKCGYSRSEEMGKKK